MSASGSMWASHEFLPGDGCAWHGVRFTCDPRRALLWRVVAGQVQRFIDPKRGWVEFGAN